MNTKISSTQNAYIKELVTLKFKSRARKKSGLFLIEGVQEISLALKSGYHIEKLLVDNKIFDEEIHKDLISNVECIEVSSEVYKKLALRESTEGILAVVQSKSFELSSIHFINNNPLILVAEAPEKPGNIGALLRTADAAGIDAVLIANPRTDMYNPNIIRSSVGCVFTTTIGLGTTKEILSFLKQHKISIYTASLEASKTYHTIDYKNASAIVVGTESTGLSDAWIENCTNNIIIPMNGLVDSMNVSVSAAILIFEAVRQRNSK